MNIQELDAYNLDDAVKFNDHLNPRLWDKNEHLRDDVRAQLLLIAEDFKETLGIKDLDLKDITISGSNAAYTYTPNSDIDLHLVVDMSEDPVYRELFDAKKFQYNETHNIKIGGFDVEVYVETADKTPITQGMYSLLQDKWLQVPRRAKANVDDANTKNKFETIGHQIEAAVKSGDSKQLDHMVRKVKRMRQTGLEQHGEFGPENLAFKMLRSQGVLQRLHDARAEAKSRELSLKERETPKSVFTYGFKTEDSVQEGSAGLRPVGLTPDGVSPDTKMIVSDVNDQPTDEEILKDFIDFCSKELKLDRMPVIKLRRDPQWSVVHKTFGRYINDKHLLEVAWGQRHIMDVLRTVAHELTHKHQHERDGERMGPDAGETGSPWENEANARAGILMRDYARLHPEFFELGQAEALHGDEVSESASGYIPTKKQAKDPRWSMALTQDIKPGQLGKEANKLNLKTNRQGHPQVANPNGLFETLALQLEAFKRGEELDEVKMSPSSLKKFADSPAAEGIMVGFEAELIVPDVNTGEDQGEMEPDYDADERCRTLDGVIEFFEYDEYGYGLGRRDAEILREKLDDAYFEWYDDQLYRDFREEAEDLIKKYMIDEGDWVWDDEVRKQLDMMEITGADQDATMQAGAEAPTFNSSKEQQAYMDEHPEYQKYIEAYSEAEDLLDELVGDEVRTQDKIWDAALEDFRDNYQIDDDSGFFEDIGLRYMSDVAERFDVYWPYMNYDGGTGSQDIDSVADSLSEALGMPVVASYSYHGATRKPGEFIIEPDGSLSPDNGEDGGLEIISPPMPIAQAMEKLNQVIEWAQARGCYTNSSTGLHMGVSLPGQKSFAEAEGDAEPAPAAEKPIDFMKLALFLGDQHVLREFGRTANSYCRSSLEKLKEKNWSPQQIATAMEKMRGNLVNLAYKDLADRSPGRDSINMKDNYVEFRGAGGDYLSKESDQGMDFLENTLLRYVQALAIAGDPNAYRQEYAKKLYKLISPEGDNTLDLFTKFATGEIDKEKLKTEWATRTLEKEKPSPDETEWEAYNTTTGEVLGTTKNFSQTNAVNYFRDDMKLTDFRVREKDPELTTSRAKFAKKIIQKPAQPKPTWNVVYRPTGRVIDQIIGVDRTEAQKLLAKVAQQHQFDNVDDLEIHNQKDTPSTPPDATEQEGTWKIVDVTLNQPVETFQGTWAQADSIARQYETGEGEHNGHEISVRRA